MKNKAESQSYINQSVVIQGTIKIFCKFTCLENKNSCLFCHFLLSFNNVM